MATLDEKMKNYWRPYQKRFLIDDSNRIIVLKARQIGFSEVAIVKGIKECITNKHRDVYLASTSLRDAKELIRRSKKWVQFLARRAPSLNKASYKKESVEFPNGSRIMAVPAHAVRGKSGTIILDEVAFLQNCEELWSDIAPAAESNPDLKLILISTPFGKRGIFHKIWKNVGNQFGNWSKHRVDVYKAAKEGFPVDPSDLKSRYPSDVFAQEFGCEFTTELSQYFSHALLLDSTWEGDLEEVGSLYGGADWASTGDASVFTPLLKAGADEPKRFIKSPHIIKPAGQSMKYSEQFETLCSILDSQPVAALATDGAGEGIQISQDIENEYPNVTIWKGTDWRDSAPQMVMDIKKDMENGDLLIANDRDLIQAFARIERLERSNKSVKFAAKRGKDGHADAFFAAVLAYAASQRSNEYTVLF